MKRATLAIAGLLAAAVVQASETELTGAEGHPRDRLPLRVWAQPLGTPSLDTAVLRAIDDWNALFAEAVGPKVFTVVAQREEAQVTIEIAAGAASGLMGLTELSSDESGVIALPVRITVVEPTARGQTSREALLYQVVAHELGHALGLPHVRDPRSLMCCVKGSVDFNDAAAREAYIQARRHPDVRSVRAQLAEQYARLWRR